MTYAMATVPYKYCKRGRTWLEYFEQQDCHKWIIALEHGKGGLKHWQLRFKVRGCDTKQGKDAYFRAWKFQFPTAHIEFTENWCDYERKEGTFVTSDDSREVLSVRFGKPNKWQQQVIYDAMSQSVREIDTYLDKKGKHGKSWLAIHLYEKGLAFLVYAPSGKQISQDICSGYKGQPFIIIDLPRDEKLSPDFYGQIERIKDGIVHDSRYSDRTRNIRGAKLIIFTNNPLNLKKLSDDRWRLHGVIGEPLP